MSTKTTPWFSGSVKPVRKGVYERRFDFGLVINGISFSYWNSKAWCYSDATPEGAASAWNKRNVSDNQTLPWRGILK